jgi:hypothetical protein
MTPSRTNPSTQLAKRSTLYHRILLQQIKIAFAGSFSNDNSNGLRKNVKLENYNDLCPHPHPHLKQHSPSEESE